ncbi:uncharacterized protein LOC143989165 isoform X2 [Lithobates pipiens]
MKRGHSNMDTQVYQVSVMFHDVAACFSAEEWSALEDWQKDLYKKVMIEIHSALQGMGFEILNPEVLFRIKKVKDLYIDISDADRTVTNSACSQRESVTGVKQEPRPNLDSCRRRGGKTTRHPACTPDLLLRINQDDASCYRDLPPQSPAHGAADTTIPSVFSKQKDSEEKRKEIRPMERPEVRINQSHRQITSQPIKQEKLEYIKVSVGEQNRNSTMVTTRGQMTSHTMKHDDDYTKAPMRGQGSESTGAIARGQVTLKPIKQEEVDYIKVAVGSQRSDDATPSRDPIDLVHTENLEDTVFSPPMDSVHRKSLADTIFSPPMALVHREFLAEAVFAPVIDSVHQESLASNVFSPQCQELGEDSSKDSSEEPSIISPGDQLNCSDTMEDQEPALETEHQDHHFSVLNHTLHNLSSNQRESNVLMQEQNSILSQIAYSLSLLHIQQTEGLAALGNIIQQGVEAIHPASCVSTNARTIDPTKVHAGLRRQVMGINRSNTDLPAPPKRKIT